MTAAELSSTEIQPGAKAHPAIGPQKNWLQMVENSHNYTKFYCFFQLQS